ncbi:MAG: trehalose-phosphatase [Candidatus Omnitrophica bacterium]|nr:trehalose-phosphatase [Candidatus Omnitrophota bacterium]
MSHYSFEAVIFDLDGVITKTAQVHFQAWKEAFEEYLRMLQVRDGRAFKEFTHEADYLPYVDGKPRYKGVQSFLESRDINIPFGQPEDAPDKETVCGIGNKKNVQFQKIVEKQGAQMYPSSINLIKELRRAGIKVGIASSSKNCQLILKSCGIEDLFETRVDGVVSVKLGLKGKPEGDIFVVAAHNVGANVSKSVVIEDATSGVQAGRNGGFGLVLGVGRENNVKGLLENGADAAVEDLSQISLEWIESWFKRRPCSLFENWQSPPEKINTPKDLQALCPKAKINPYYLRSAKEGFSGNKKPVFFLDYDGTLTPIVSRPDLAILDDKMRQTLADLSGKFQVFIVSGRMREDVENLVGLKGVFYAGSHGFDILGPSFVMVEPRAEKTIPLIAAVTKEISRELAGIEGVLIEEKKFSLAVHYRLVDEKHLPGIEEAVNKKVVSHNELRLMKGKKVFEILPAIDWDKGKAIRWIIAALGLSWDRANVVYIGDDTTDEDAFRMIRTRGMPVLVAEDNRTSCADFRLSSVEEVKKLFEDIINNG